MPPVSESPEILDLLTPERGAFLSFPPMTGFNIFEGSIPTDFLRDRVAKIVELNPWLGGRLVRGKPTSAWSKKFGLSKPPVVLSIPAKPLAPSFQIVSKSALVPGLCYDQIFRLLAPIVVKNGDDCVDRDEPLFKVVVVDLVPGKLTALVTSMSHVIFDGHTQYCIFNMLSQDVEPYAMVAPRVFSFEDELAKALGKEALAWPQSPSYIAGLMGNLARSPAMKLHFVDFDVDEIGRLKAQHIADAAAKANQSTASINGEGPPGTGTGTGTPAKKPKSGSKPAGFVSTNDVVTSWYMNTFELPFATLAMNYRPLLAKQTGLTQLHAGNYEYILPLRGEDATSPQQVRRAVAKAASLSSTGAKPTHWERLSGNHGCVTNVTSFYKDLVFEGAKLRTHTPIYDVESRDMFPMRSLFVFYKPNDNTTSAMMFTRGVDDRVIQAMAASKMVRRVVSSVKYLI